MPKQEEIAELVINGERFSAWETVRVDFDAQNPHSQATFTVAEALSNQTVFSALRIRVGDRCQVYLAGIKVLDGYVFQRQACYNATMHGVLISACSKTFDAAQCSAPLKTSQMAGYPFESIARTVLSPYGIGIVIKNPPPGFDRPFKDVSIQPGETVFELVERLARQRGAWISGDENGNYVVGGGDPKAAPVADFEEGRNILSANCCYRDDVLYRFTDVMGQGRGDDNVNGAQSSQPAASVSNSSVQRYRNLYVVSEEPGSAQDMAVRADTETMMRLAQALTCMVTVQGWLRAPGQLWKVGTSGENYSVKSPMLLLHGVKLAAQSVTFEQTNGGGTTTTLMLVRPEALSKSALGNGLSIDTGSSDNQSTPENSSSELPGGAPSAASPIAIDI